MGPAPGNNPLPWFRPRAATQGAGRKYSSLGGPRPPKRGLEPDWYSLGWAPRFPGPGPGFHKAPGEAHPFLESAAGLGDTTRAGELGNRGMLRGARQNEIPPKGGQIRGDFSPVCVPHTKIGARLYWPPRVVLTNGDITGPVKEGREKQDLPPLLEGGPPELSPGREGPPRCIFPFFWSPRGIYIGGEKAEAL